jgi:hypothetical protein
MSKRLGVWEGGGLNRIEGRCLKTMFTQKVGVIDKVVGLNLPNPSKTRKKMGLLCAV